MRSVATGFRCSFAQTAARDKRLTFPSRPTKKQRRVRDFQQALRSGALPRELRRDMPQRLVFTCSESLLTCFGQDSYGGFHIVFHASHNMLLPTRERSFSHAIRCCRLPSLFCCCSSCYRHCSWSSLVLVFQRTLARRTYFNGYRDVVCSSEDAIPPVPLLLLIAKEMVLGAIALFVSSSFRENCT